MTQAEYDDASEKALRLFEYGQVIKLFFLSKKKLPLDYVPVLVGDSKDA